MAWLSLGKGRYNEARGITLQSVLVVSERRPIVIHAETTAHDPLGTSRGIPRKSDTWAERGGERVIEDVALLKHGPISDLAVQALSRPEMKIRKRGASQWVRIAKVIPAQSKGQR